MNGLQTDFDTDLQEWIARWNNHPELGWFYGNTATEAEAQACEALRVQSDHARRNTWTEIVPGVYEVKGGAA